MSESPEQQPLIRPATNNLAPYQALLVVIGLLGALPYAAVLAITYSTPVWVEEVGRDFIERKARERFDESVARVQIAVTPDGDSQLGLLASPLYEKNETALRNCRPHSKRAWPSSSRWRSHRFAISIANAARNGRN